MLKKVCREPAAPQHHCCSVISGDKRQQGDARSSITSQLAALAHLDPGVHLLLLVVLLLVLRAGVSLQMLHAGRR